MYVITNSSLGGFALTLKTASSPGISIPNGATRTVFFDGTDFVDTVTATKSLLLDGNATQNLQAVTKQQMDAALALKISRDGSIAMTGPLILSTSTLNSSAAATTATPKGYVDSFVPLAGNATAMTGPLILYSTDPTGFQATSKSYNDSFYVAKTGSTMTGALTLYSTLPTTAWQAVPKQYVDNISVAYGSGISITGTIAANNVMVNLLPATASTLGGVKVGSGINLAVDGTITVSATATGITSVTAAPGAPIVANTVGSAVTLSMATNAYYPYSSNTYLTTSGTAADSSKLGGTAAASYATQSWVTGQGYLTSVPAGTATQTYVQNYSVAKTGDTMSGTLNISQSATQLAFAAFGNDRNWIASATGSSVSNTSFIALTLNDNGSTGTFRGVLSSGHTGSAADWPLLFSVGSALRVQISTAGDMFPYTDNSISCGTAGNKWTSIWAVNGSIQTSDATQKTAIADTDLGLDFITALRPVSYKWKVGQNIVQVPDNLTEASDGCKDHPVVARPGVRTHYGLVAQEVKAVLGDKDFGGYIDAGFSDGVEGEKGLRYDQFISPLIKAIQELNAKVEALTAEVNTLKGA